jgi:cytochrome bd ubiquinol oxidase subunit II
MSKTKNSPTAISTKEKAVDSYWLAQFIMYVVLMFAIVAYAVLDGFDLGVGCLHLFSKGNQERRIMINAIGPVWDGNSTWIVIGGGVLFAAFPKAFSILCPNLYTPFMVMLFGFMLRAASIEFRSKRDEKWWSPLWDRGFFLASFLLALMIGTVLGNLIQGIPLNDQGELVGGVMALLTPYPVLIAVFGISCFMMHGALYLLMKTEGSFHNKIRRWAHRTIWGFMVMWIVSTIVTVVIHPHMIEPFHDYPVLAIFPLLSFGAIFGMLHAVKKKWDGLAFTYSCLSILFMLVLFVIGTFPNIAYSTINPDQNSLTLMNSSVSEFALWILAGVSLTGVPLSFFYFPYIYRVFKGKISIDSMSY